MKKILFSSAWVTFVLIPTLTQANTISLTYGSKYDEQTQTALFYADQWGSRLTAQNPGLIAAGYFDDGFDPVAASHNISIDGISPILAAFNMIDSKSSIEANASEGYILVEKDVQEEGLGKTPYILLLAGVETFDLADESTGIGLFTDSTFTTIPAGSSLPPTEYYLDTLSYDTVLLGSSQATTDPSSGTVYIPHSLGVPPLILASSDQLSEHWWKSSWFGAFSTHPNSAWIFHPAYGWVYPNSTSSTGLWFYESTQYGWLFMNSAHAPFLWSHSQQKWLYPYEESASLEFWEWNSSTQLWSPPQ